MEVLSSSSSSNKKYSRKPSKRKYQNVPGQDNNNGASEDPLALQSTDENEVEISNLNDDCIAVASMELSVDDAIGSFLLQCAHLRIGCHWTTIVSVPRVH